MRKKLISFLLAATMILSIIPTALAASEEAQVAAQSLYEQGLFKGTGTNADGTPNFDLDRTPTRHEAVTMLVRLLGKEEEAVAGTWETPFTDVADWAKAYVGYAYANGLTAGTSATTYSGDNTINAAQYITFVLRSLGYESGKDFQWDKPWELSEKIGLTHGNYNADTTEFTRGDIAIISMACLAVEGQKQNISANDLQGVWCGSRVTSWGSAYDYEWVFDGNTIIDSSKDAEDGTLLSLLTTTFHIDDKNIIQLESGGTEVTIFDAYRENEAIVSGKYTYNWKFQIEEFDGNNLVIRECTKGDSDNVYTFQRATAATLIPAIQELLEKHKDKLTKADINSMATTISDIAEEIIKCGEASQNAIQFYANGLLKSFSSQSEAKKYYDLADAQLTAVHIGAYVIKDDCKKVIEICNKYSLEETIALTKKMNEMDKLCDELLGCLSFSNDTAKVCDDTITSMANVLKEVTELLKMING